MSTEINIKKKLAILEESVTVTNDASSINFTGNGVTASNVDGNTTVTIPGGSGTTTYYLNQSVTQTPYKEFSSVATSIAEQTVPFTIAGGATTIVAEYQTPIGVPNTTQIPTGLWQFFLHFNAGTTGQNWIIRPTVYKRDLGGIETLLLTLDPVVVTNMPTVTTMYICDAVFPASTVLTSDRIVVKISMENATGVSQTATFRTEGSQHYSVGLTTLNQVVPNNAVTDVTGTAPIQSSGGTTPAISITQASAIADGYLSSSDFAIFNAKVPATRNITINGNTQDLSADRTWTIATSIPQANTIYVDSVNGINATTGRGDINTPYLTPEYALGNITNTGTVTATTTSTSATLTAVSDTTNIKVGQYITGTGIPYGSQVISKTSNTIVLSKTCTAGATITATWWTAYNVVLIGTFNVVSNIHKAGFYIDSKTYNATINFGAFTLFLFTSSVIIPVGFKLGRTNGTSSSSKLHQTAGNTGVTINLDYGDYYSIGTDRALGNTWNYSGDCNITGNMMDCRFGWVAYLEGGNIYWNGNAYGLLGGIYAGGKFVYNGTITTPASVLAIQGANNFSINGNIYGSVSIGTGLNYVGSVYANIVGTTVTLNGGSGSGFSIYGDIIANVNTTGLVNFYGYIYGNLTYTNGGGAWDGTNIFQSIYGTLTVSSGACNYYGTSSNNGSQSTTVIIGTGTLINYGVLNGCAFTYTGAGKIINNGTILVGVGNQITPPSIISNAGTFINNPTGTVRYDGTVVSALMTKTNGTLINNGRMVNTSRLYVNYSANTSASKDIVVQNSYTNGNGANGGVVKGTGNILWLDNIVASTNTSVTFFDGTNSVTISVVGAGKTTAQISAEIVTLVKASILNFQCCEVLYLGRVYFIGLQSITTTATSLINCTTATNNTAGGLSFVPNILVAGTEINDYNLNY